MSNYSDYPAQDKENVMESALLPNPDTRSCRQPHGSFAPLINRNKCEGKGPCVDVCPYSVLEMGPLSKLDRAGLSLVGKIKAFAHGGKQAFAVAPNLCAACGLCVQACPENAIALVRRDGKEER
jgi:4Fe-4S ferredoxin